MNTRIQRATSTPTAPEQTSESRHPIAEWALLVVAAVVGVYSMGAGLGSLYGESGNPWWLVVTAAALIILSMQMGRVHDLWPHRPKRERAAVAPTTLPSSAAPDTAEGAQP
ncbi:MAG TPA: hypothetical protein VE338_15065 [Ktedonobacterales bacterium]|jgi:membrane protein YdbS with pleckstrin-like domain|nr:hypothetical protein [Ktedonobacterales bacterium]